MDRGRDREARNLIITDAAPQLRRLGAQSFDVGLQLHSAGFDFEGEAKGAAGSPVCDGRCRQAFGMMMHIGQKYK